MEDNQEKPSNKYITYIKNNKYNVYFIVAIAVLISMIVAMITITFTHSNTKYSANPSPTQIPLPTTSSLSNSPSPETPSITTPDPTQAAIIGDQTAPQISPNVAVPYTIQNIKIFSDNWATMQINNPTVGNGLVIVKKINGSWKVEAGPGSYFPMQQLQSIGAPQTLINSMYPSVSISPSQ